ncbi:Calcium and integrin-binding protein 1 [Chionoecetes opilio]|uniref:Calcium and integrin-binding protein 1 n=1 Tax=Chionoecetes opilio TaxID=41210 RepID=A0A8J5CJV5_CHIOP|nr:Calcium and integrin-binding protein 1 [Chionoecetes opilio]
MGQGNSQFTEAELQEYQVTTRGHNTTTIHRSIQVTTRVTTHPQYIDHTSAHKRFKNLALEKVGHNRNAKLPMDKLLTLPELRANPFCERMCLIFSSTKDGDCTFEDFLDMMSVFSEAAPKSVKAEYAFRIFDFDGDDYLGRGDLEETITKLVSPQRFSPGDMEASASTKGWKYCALVNRVLEEADLDDDGMLAFAEFEHVISKSPDFAK